MSNVVKLFDKPIEGVINITKKNIQTGEETKYPEMHNLLTEWFNRYMLVSNISNLFDAMYLKVGRGSTAPSTSDTSITTDNTTWYGGSSTYFSSLNRKVTFLSKNSMSLTYRFVIPATETATGILSELGLFWQGYLYYKDGSYWRNRQNTLITHSLLKDAEGHPYQIDKGSLDELTIEYTLIFSSQDANFLKMIYVSQATRQDSSSGLSFETNIFNKIRCFIPTAQSSSSEFLVALSRHIDEVDIRNLNEIFIDCAYAGYRSMQSDQAMIPDRTDGYDAFRYTSDGSSVYPAQYYPRDLCDNSSVSIPPRRLSAKWGKNGHYILFFKFLFNDETNRAIEKSFVELGFTSDTLEDYAIGEGDGVTTDFKPPLNHWKKNTEKIYIDGVLQTRGVDYTCDNDNNLDNLGELTPLFHAKIIDGYACQMDSSYGYARFYSWCYQDHPNKPVAPNAYHMQNSGDFSTYPSTVNLANEIVILPRLECGDYNQTTKKYYDFPYSKKGFRLKSLSNDQNFEIGFDVSQSILIEQFILSTDHPMIFEIPIEKMEELKLNATVDTIYLWCGDSSVYYTFSVSYSNDGETWTKIVDHQTGYKNSAAGRTHSNAYEASLSEWCEYAIGSEVKMKYWKLEMHYNPSSTPSSPTYMTQPIGFFIRKSGSPIQFTNAPAAGSVITMDADTDIPFKDAKHVIDIGATISFN